MDKIRSFFGKSESSKNKKLRELVTKHQKELLTYLMLLEKYNTDSITSLHLHFVFDEDTAISTPSRVLPDISSFYTVYLLQLISPVQDTVFRDIIFVDIERDATYHHISLSLFSVLSSAIREDLSNLEMNTPSELLSVPLYLIQYLVIYLNTCITAYTDPQETLQCIFLVYSLYCGNPGYLYQLVHGESLRLSQLPALQLYLARLSRMNDVPRYIEVCQVSFLLHRILNKVAEGLRSANLALETALFELSDGSAGRFSGQFSPLYVNQGLVALCRCANIALDYTECSLQYGVVMSTEHTVYHSIVAVHSVLTKYLKLLTGVHHLLPIEYAQTCTHWASGVVPDHSYRVQLLDRTSGTLLLFMHHFQQIVCLNAATCKEYTASMVRLLKIVPQCIKSVLRHPAEVYKKLVDADNASTPMELSQGPTIHIELLVTQLVLKYVIHSIRNEVPSLMSVILVYHPRVFTQLIEGVQSVLYDTPAMQAVHQGAPGIQALLDEAMLCMVHFYRKYKTTPLPNQKPIEASSIPILPVPIDKALLPIKKALFSVLGLLKPDNGSTQTIEYIFKYCIYLLTYASNTGTTTSLELLEIAYNVILSLFTTHFIDHFKPGVIDLGLLFVAFLRTLTHLVDLHIEFGDDTRVPLLESTLLIGVEVVYAMLCGCLSMRNTPESLAVYITSFTTITTPSFNYLEAISVYNTKVVVVVFQIYLDQLRATSDKAYQAGPDSSTYCLIDPLDKLVNEVLKSNALRLIVLKQVDLVMDIYMRINEDRALEFISTVTFTKDNTDNLLLVTPLLRHISKLLTSQLFTPNQMLHTRVFHLLYSVEYALYQDQYSYSHGTTMHTAEDTEYMLNYRLKIASIFNPLYLTNICKQCSVHKDTDSFNTRLLLFIKILILIEYLSYTDLLLKTELCAYTQQSLLNALLQTVIGPNSMHHRSVTHESSLPKLLEIGNESLGPSTMSYIIKVLLLFASNQLHLTQSYEFDVDKVLNSYKKNISKGYFNLSLCYPSIIVDLLRQLSHLLTVTTFHSVLQLSNTLFDYLHSLVYESTFRYHNLYYLLSHNYSFDGPDMPGDSMGGLFTLLLLYLNSYLRLFDALYDRSNSHTDYSFFYKFKQSTTYSILVNLLSDTISMGADTKGCSILQIHTSLQAILSLAHTSIDISCYYRLNCVLPIITQLYTKHDIQSKVPIQLLSLKHKSTSNILPNTYITPLHGRIFNINNPVTPVATHTDQLDGLSVSLLLLIPATRASQHRRLSGAQCSIVFYYISAPYNQIVKSAVEIRQKYIEVLHHFKTNRLVVFYAVLIHMAPETKEGSSVNCGMFYKELSSLELPGDQLFHLTFAFQLSSEILNFTVFVNKTLAIADRIDTTCRIVKLGTRFPGLYSAYWAVCMAQCPLRETAPAVCVGAHPFSPTQPGIATPTCLQGLQSLVVSFTGPLFGVQVHRGALSPNEVAILQWGTAPDTVGSLHCIPPSHYFKARNNVQSVLLPLFTHLFESIPAEGGTHKKSIAEDIESLLGLVHRLAYGNRDWYTASIHNCIQHYLYTQYQWIAPSSVAIFFNILSSAYNSYLLKGYEQYSSEVFVNDTQSLTFSQLFNYMCLIPNNIHTNKLILHYNTSTHHSDSYLSDISTIQTLVSHSRQFSVSLNSAQFQPDLLVSIESNYEQYSYTIYDTLYTIYVLPLLIMVKHIQIFLIPSIIMNADGVKGHVFSDIQYLNTFNSSVTAMSNLYTALTSTVFGMATLTNRYIQLLHSLVSFLVEIQRTLVNIYILFDRSNQGVNYLIERLVELYMDISQSFLNHLTDTKILPHLSFCFFNGISGINPLMQFIAESLSRCLSTAAFSEMFNTYNHRLFNLSCSLAIVILYYAPDKNCQTHYYTQCKEFVDKYRDFNDIKPGSINITEIRNLIVLTNQSSGNLSSVNQSNGFPNQSNVNQSSGVPNQSSGVPNQSSGVPNQSSGVPNQSSGVPNQSSGVPNQSSGVPNQSSGVPNQSSGVPNQSSGVPNQSSDNLLSGVPNQSSGVPNQSSGVPNQSSGVPNQSSGVPNQSSGVPNQSSGVPNQSSGVPNQSSGVPNQSSGVPNQSSGVPNQSSGVPNQSSGVPNQSSGVPNQSSDNLLSGVPNQSSGVPNQSSGVPNQSSGVPNQSSGVPNQSSGVPNQSSGVPNQSSGVPNQSSGVPNQSSGVPNQSSGVPNQSSGVPNQSSGVPNQSSGVPNQSSGVPNQSSGVPNQSSGVPNQSSGVPNQSSGVPNQSSGVPNQSSDNLLSGVPNQSSGVPNQSSGVPNQSSGVPNQSSGVPNQSSGVPNQSSGVPNQSSGVPNQSSGVPNQSSGVPNQSSGVPNQSSGVPNQSSGVPNQSSDNLLSGVPNQSSGVPNQSSGVPNQSSGVPNQSSGVPNQSSGVPNQSSGVPNQSSGVPNQSSGVPNQSSGVPNQSSGVPNQSSGVPNQSSGVPNQSSGVPNQSSGVPNQSSGVPNQSSGVPNQSSGVPNQSSGVPNQSSGVPNQSSGVPNQSSGVPNQSSDNLLSGVPNQSSGVPNQSSGVPNQSSGVPNQSSGVPNQSSGVPNQSSGVPNQSSGVPNQSSDNLLSGVPNQSSGVPNQSSGVPNQSSGVPNQSSGVPNQSSGVPNQSSGVPNQSSGVPNQSSGVPNQSSGVPNQSSGVPNQSSGVPNQSSGVPNQSSGVPNQSSGVPNQSSGVPNQSSGVPNQSSGVPNQSSGVPNQSSDNLLSGVPNQSSGVPNQSSGVPNQSSGVPNQSSGVS